ncbi:protein DENND6B isoform X4 [Balaenoptera ricei]|uniref:protein DENND6B isoform X4 n=1 Tax=Balaenoptera ricei TaxID=2746895 RepID=UPI0028BD989F|nr:protein DENND6B isoform X4 [Balaenoptera ricei]
MDQGSAAGPHRARGRLGAPSCGARAPGAPWARFSAWLECVCVVTFDLELGQALELVYPSDFQLTDKEKSSICYLSFPDSHSGCLGDTQFSFRIRQCGGQRRPWHTDDRHCDSGAPVSLQAGEGQLREEGLLPEAWSPTSGHSWEVGGTPCPGRPWMSRASGVPAGSQGAGATSHRPRALQSLVLVSRLPFVRLFQALLSLVAPEYFDKLAPCLEAVCDEIDQWPAPVPGQTLNLPVMGVVLQVHIPSRADKPESGPPKQCSHENLLPAPVVLTSVHELDLFRCFRPVLAHVQLLWELMLLGEPLLVLAPSPAVSSEMVLALTSCLQPLKFCCDYRPYFTVHDSEFKEFTTRTQAPPSVVLGVTNPFFIKTLQHWPHVLRIGEPKMPGDLPKQVKLKKPSRLKTLDTKPGLYTAYTTYLHRDKALLRRLLKVPLGGAPGAGKLGSGVKGAQPACCGSALAPQGLQKKRPSDVQSAVLRRHLLELTQSFLSPLEHYMASLMPLQKSITPWKTPPQIHPFHQDDFLRSLEHSGPQLTCLLKGDRLGLYRWADSRRFFKSPHFDGWYRQRHKEMAQKLEALHLEAICEAVRGALGCRRAQREHRDLDEGQVRGGGRGSGPETSGEAGSGTGPPAPREGGDAEAGAAVHRDSHRLPAQGPAGRPVPSLGWGPWPRARVWPSSPPPSQARAPPPKLPAAPGPGPPPGTTIIPADKVAFGTTAWPLTVGGSRAGSASPPPGPHLPSPGS